MNKVKEYTKARQRTRQRRNEGVFIPGALEDQPSPWAEVEYYHVEPGEGEDGPKDVMEGLPKPFSVNPQDKEVFIPDAHTPQAQAVRQHEGDHIRYSPKDPPGVLAKKHKVRVGDLQALEDVRLNTMRATRLAYLRERHYEYGEDKPLLADPRDIYTREKGKAIIRDALATARRSNFKHVAGLLQASAVLMSTGGEGLDGMNEYLHQELSDKPGEYEIVHAVLKMAAKTNQYLRPASVKAEGPTPVGKVYNMAKLWKWFEEETRKDTGKSLTNRAFNARVRANTSTVGGKPMPGGVFPEHAKAGMGTFKGTGQERDRPAHNRTYKAEPLRMPNGFVVKWWPMQFLEPHRPLNSDPRGKSLDRIKNMTGPKLVRPEQLWRVRFGILPRMFQTKRPQTGVSVLVDVSGSMGWSQKLLDELLKKAPASTLGIYGITHRTRATYGGGALAVLASKKKRIPEKEVHEMAKLIKGQGNGVDGPALEWLAQQPGPRIWVSDGCANGAPGGNNSYAQRMCIELCEAHDIERMEKAEYLEMLGLPTSEAIEEEDYD